MESNNKEMPIGILMEKAKIEYIEKINEITKKYDLPLYLLAMIMNQIVNEINITNKQQLEYDMKQLLSEENSTENNKDNKEDNANE